MVHLSSHGAELAGTWYTPSVQALFTLKEEIPPREVDQATWRKPNRLHGGKRPRSQMGKGAGGRGLLHPP